MPREAIARGRESQRQKEFVHGASCSIGTYTVHARCNIGNEYYIIIYSIYTDYTHADSGIIIYTFYMRVCIL